MVFFGPARLERTGETRTMKAAIYRRYGPPDVVRVETVAKPQPKPGEVLIKIRATTVSSADWRARSLVTPRGFGFLSRLFFGLFKPRQPILGSELAGEIAEIGPGVTRFKPGDKVFAFPGVGLGCHAQFRTMPEDGRIALKPANLSFEEAAALCFGGSTALHFLRDAARIRSGERVLVIGASGAVGSAAVQIAKHFGADVTAVCSAANADLVTSIGASRVIDYTNETDIFGGAAYDVIFDAAGQASFGSCKIALSENGRLILIASDLKEVLASLLPRGGGRKVFAGPAKETVEQLEFLKQLAETGRFKPVIGATYPLERIAEAHALVETGHKRGNAVITIGHDGE